MQHHAYFIEGPLALFAAYKERLKPFWAKEFEKFGIEEARALGTLASLRSAGESVFFIATPSMTSEAQQALLKLFEEPQRGIAFVLLVPHGTLIATLRSRMLPYPEVLKGAALASVKKFLAGTGAARSAEVAALLKDEEGLRERARDFLNALEAELHAKLKDPKVRVALQDIAAARSYLSDRSPSLKMLLEHLALSLPRV